MMVIGFVKRNVRRKTEQSTLRMKRRKLSWKFKEFNKLLLNKGLETSSSQGYKHTKERLVSTMSSFLAF